MTEKFNEIEIASPPTDLQNNITSGNNDNADEVLKDAAHDVKTKKNKDYDSIAAKMAIQLEVPLDKIEKIYNVGLPMLNNGISEANFSEFIQQMYDIPKDDADEIASIMNLETISKDSAKKPKKDEIIWNVADSIASEHKVICMSESRKLFRYEGGIYLSDGVEIHLENLMAKCAKDAYDNILLKSNLNNALHRIEYTTTIPQSEFNKNIDTIVVNNGLVNIDTGEFREHTPDEIYTNKFDFDYNPDAKLPPTFINYLKTTFKGVEYQIDILQEFFGYCLSQEYFITGFFIFIGGGGNGKGVFLNVMAKFFGDENISALSLNQICSNDRFNLSHLYGKKINMCGDIGKSAIKATDNIKKLTGRDLITAQFKGKDLFDFRNTAKIAFASNEMPEIDDESEGFGDRLNIIDFPNKIRNTAEDDPDLEKKLTTPESLSGILTWALEGYKRLQQNGKFSHHKTNKEKKAILNKKTNPVHSFVEDCVQFQDGGFVPNKVLFNNYKLYAKKHNLPNRDSKNFFPEFELECNELGINTSPAQPTINGKRPRGYKNIKVSIV